MFKQPLTFDRVMRIVFAVIIIAIIVWLIDILRDVLLPFCAACLVAYILEPIVEWHQRVLKIKNRPIPVILTLIEVSVVVVGLSFILVPSAIDEVDRLGQLVKSSSQHRIHSQFIPPEVEEYIHNSLNIDNISQYISGSRLESVLNKSTSVLTAVIDLLMHTLEWLLMFIYIIFVMLDYKQLMNGFRLSVPPRYRKPVYRVADDIKDSMNRYFRSQALIACFAAFFYCIGFLIVGLPMAIVLGLLVGLLYMIPYFQYITLIPVAALCFVSSMTGDAEFLVMFGKCILVYVFSQCVCDYVLTPRIMGKSLGLNPAIILLSLSVWGSLLGILGMIIALPFTALLISYYKEFVLHSNVTDSAQVV